MGSPNQNFEATSEIRWWMRVAGFALLIPFGAGSAFVTLALLSTLGIIQPKQNLLQIAGGLLIGMLLIYGPIWKTLRRDWSVFSGLVFGITLTAGAWWSIYVA